MEKLLPVYGSDLHTLFIAYQIHNQLFKRCSFECSPNLVKFISSCKLENLSVHVNLKIY